MNIETITDVNAGAAHMTPPESPAACIPANWPAPASIASPADVESVVAAVRWAEEAGNTIVPVGGGTMLRTGAPPRADRAYLLLSFAGMQCINDYQPDDLTVTCEPGITLETLQRHLAQRRQFLALDAPFPATATLGGIVASGASGLWRPAYGAPRDLLIGMRAVMTGGVEVRGGGKVVKNVAGYDVCKLFTGSWGAIGALTELTFKVRPLPAVERSIGWVIRDAAAAASLGLELHLAGLALTYVLTTQDLGGTSRLIVGMHGTDERVDWQSREAARRVSEREPTAERCDPDAASITALRDRGASGAPGAALAARVSCLPSALPQFAAQLQAVPGVSCDLHCSTGIAAISTATGTAEAAQAMRRAAPPESNLIWTRMDLPAAAALALTAAIHRRDDTKLQHALKSSLDPRGTFGDGRSPAGL